MENKRKVKIYIIIIYFKINFLKNNLINFNNYFLT